MAGALCIVAALLAISIGRSPLAGKTSAVPEPAR
jgi:hypothetical protein